MTKPKRKDINKDRNYPVYRECKSVQIGVEALEPIGAHSVGIGRKCVHGKATDQLCIRYYVSRKRPAGRLSSGERIPESVEFFSRKKGKTVRLATDIIESPPAQFEQVDPESRLRPVPGGCSGGAAGHSGTIGGWVWDTTDDTIVMLSNDHVFEHNPGDDIVQPSILDGGSLPADKIGDVKRGIARSSTTPNQVDCSIGDPDDSSVYDLSVIEIGPAVYSIAVPVGDMLVEKYGQTTRHTFGEITDADWSGNVSGRPFEDCLRVDAVAPSADWSAGGDSGSLVFSQTPIAADSDIKPVVGLHFAGADTHGIECKIQNVFSALNLTTLCAGAFAAFLDALFEVETEEELSEEAEGRLRFMSALAARRVRRFAPQPFVRKDKLRAGAGNLFTGISRDMQKRLDTSRRGRVATAFVDRHRAELLSMLTKDGDIRRATVASIQPLVAGATTTTDVLERVLTERDLAKIDKLTKEVSRRASRRLQLDLRALRALRSRAEGKSIAEIVGIKL